MAMMVSLQRRLDNVSDGDQEWQFFSHALRYLTTASGRQVEMESWMITSYEVEFGRRIGSGGLCVLFLVQVVSAFCPLILNQPQRGGVRRNVEQHPSCYQGYEDGKWHHAQLDGALLMVFAW
jgi:hypothetical protein